MDEMLLVKHSISIPALHVGSLPNFDESRHLPGTSCLACTWDFGAESITRWQFGKAVKDDRQFSIAIAQVLEWIGSVLRDRPEAPRGRVNVDLAKSVNAILKHQREKLTQRELYEALKEAGAELPEDPQAFRGWLHRARKSGLVTE